jgi:subtilase family serine protease
LNLQDIRDFRSAAGLPPSEPKVLVYPGSLDTGFTDALGEALLDVQYAGGAAPGASILYVYGNNANLAAQYATDQNLAPIISESFGMCEKRASGWDWMRNLAQQAAAKGITWVV